MLKDLFTPVVNLRRWISNDKNPCAPQFNPAMWNDAGPLSSKNKKLYQFQREYINDIDENEDLRVILRTALGMDVSELCFHSFYTAPEKFSKRFSISRESISSLQELGRTYFSKIQFTNNCYSYAWNDAVVQKIPGDLPPPGYRSGCAQYWNITLEDTLEKLEKDGAHFCGYTLPSIKDDYYRAVFMTSKASGQYLPQIHFRREDNDGGVSEKWGHNPVSRVRPSYPSNQQWENAAHSCEVYGYLQIPANK
jgi:hypothetical protein